MEPGGGGGGGTPSQTCAVCKHLGRRQCSPDCTWGPYFPASHTREFQDVHRLYGLSNLTKICQSLPPGKKRETAMRTIILEAGMRRQDPIYGVCGVIRNLQAQIAAAQRELDGVQRLLALSRWLTQPHVLLHPPGYL